MLTIRDALEELSGEALSLLCEKRGLRGARTLADRRTKLSRSYRGNHRAFFADLRRKDLEEVLSGTWYDGRKAYRLKYMSSYSKEQLEAIALALFTQPGVPDALQRVPDEDDDEADSADELGDDLVSRVLAMLPKEVLAAVAEGVFLSASGTHARLAARVRQRVGDDLGTLLTVTLSRNGWNDVVEALGGRRRKSFEDIAGELAMLAAATTDDGDEAADTMSVAPAAGLVGREVAAPVLPIAPVIGAAGAQTSAPATRPAAASVRLVTDDRDLIEAFGESCTWAESFEGCVPAVDTHGGRAPLWGVLARHLRKLDRLYVALDALRTDALSLETLYRAGSLRVVTAADASVRAHLWVFRRGERVRVITGSGLFGGGGLVAPLVSATLWEGPSLDPFALAARRLLDRARAIGYLPEPGFAEDYRALAEQVRPHGEAMLEAAASRYLRRLSVDAAGETLDVIRDAERARAAIGRLRHRLLEIATRVEDQWIAGAQQPYTVYWVPAVSMWGLYGDLTDQAWNVFGVDRPNGGSWLQPLARVDVAFAGSAGEQAVVAEDSAGACYLLAKGPEPDAAVADAIQVFWNRVGGGLTVTTRDGRPSRFAIVTCIDAPSCVRDLAAFVHEIARVRAPGAPGFSKDVMGGDA